MNHKSHSAPAIYHRPEFPEPTFALKMEIWLDLEAVTLAVRGILRI